MVEGGCREKWKCRCLCDIFFFVDWEEARRFGLEESLTHRAADQGASDGDSLVDSLVILERGVDLHQVHGDQAAGLMDSLADVVALTEVEASTDGGTGRGSDSRVEGIDIEAQVDGARAVRRNMLDGHLDDLGDAVLVNLVHGEGLDAVLTEDLLLTSIDITETDVDQAVGGEAGLDPAELLELASDSKKERDRAAVDVTTVGGLRGVNVSVSIDPDQTCIGVDSHGTRDSSKGDRVITTEGQGKGALLEVGGNRGGNRLSHSRDVASVQELADGGVALRAHQGVVAVAVKLDLPVELLQLVEKTKLDDLERAKVDTISGLATREGDADNADRLLLKELVLDSRHDEE